MFGMVRGWVNCSVTSAIKSVIDREGFGREDMLSELDSEVDIGRVDESMGDLVAFMSGEVDSMGADENIVGDGGGICPGFVWKNSSLL
jgi:hypothetical protein